jgi:hypothetical protein
LPEDKCSSLYHPVVSVKERFIKSTPGCWWHRQQF